MYKNANRKTNVFYRFRNVSNIETREVIHNTFIVWHFCDKTSIRKMEKSLMIII